MVFSLIVLIDRMLDYRICSKFIVWYIV